ncbi:MAG: acetate--CoA ligase [Pseudomonadota bacterium]
MINNHNDNQFWEKIAERLEWHKRWDSVNDSDFKTGVIRWFDGGKLSVSENCLDRHLKTQPDKIAIIWESDDGKENRKITYKELHREVCKAANALIAMGVGVGERVTIYMPMIPEAAIAMLACARIGAVHSVVFGGFSAQSLRGRIIDADSRIVITADEGLRGGKRIPLKATVDEAITGTNVDKILVVQRTGTDIKFNRGRDVWWHDAITMASDEFPVQYFDAEHPLFILYTSGSTGKPKGLLHTCGGYLTWASYTHKEVFDLKPDDIFWCTADIGWVTGHTYTLYAPLSNGATTLMFEGVPNYPDSSRFWQIVDKYKVTIFYTAPTAIRALMRDGQEWVKKSSRKSLRILGSVGEPINPEAWRWYNEVVGESRCPIVDTWWQTETGATLISPLAGKTKTKAGSATFPLQGIKPVLLDEKGKEIEGEGEGALCIAAPWPSLARTIYGDHERYRQTYFAPYEGYYFTGDGAKRDADGYYWITGRMDDVLNVSGHRLGTAEIESALVAHPKVAEAAVVGVPHDIKGEGIYAYVTLNGDVETDEQVKTELKAWVRTQIGAIAMPDVIHFAPQLPKTRSGKIMRRILRKIAVGQLDQLGDTSTLLNPEAVEMLIAGR